MRSPSTFVLVVLACVFVVTNPLEAHAADPKQFIVNCSKAGKTEVRLSELLRHELGNKVLKKATKMPTVGTLFGWDGHAFSIPLKSFEDFSTYLDSIHASDNHKTKHEKASKKKTKKGAATELPKQTTSLKRAFVRARLQYRAPVIKKDDKVVDVTTGTGVDWLNLQLEVRNGANERKDMEVSIRFDVKNTPPRVINAAPRIVDNKPRYINLGVRDRDEANVAPLQEITEVWVAIPNASSCACTVRLSSEPDSPSLKPDGTRVMLPNVADKNARRVWVIPPATFPTGSTCQFNFGAKDFNGEESKVGTVTVTASDVVKPLAFSTRARVKRNGEGIILELYGSSGNTDRFTNVTFFATQMPQNGTLYFAKSVEAASTAKKIDPAKEGPTKLYEGTSRRIQLVYVPDAVPMRVGSDGKPRPVDKSLPKIDLLKYTLFDGFQKSDEAVVSIRTVSSGTSVYCRDVDIQDAFIDRSSSIVLDYGFEDPGDGRGEIGRRFNRLALLSGPQTPYGFIGEKMSIGNNQTVRRVGPHDTFQDGGRGTLLWIPDRIDEFGALNFTAANPEVVEEYSWKATTDTGDHCSAKLRIHIRPHGSVDPVTKAYKWVERARTGNITVFGLRRGLAAETKTVKSIRIKSLPTVGTLYTANANFPYQTQKVYGGYGKSMRSYCQRFKCNSYLDKPAEVGQEVGVVNDPTAPNSRAIYLLYVGPAQMPRTNDTITVDYEVVYTTGDEPQQRQLVIALVPGDLPVLEFTFDPPSSRGNLSTATEPKVKLALAQPGGKFAVELVGPDRERRHFLARPFRLHQYDGMDGGTPRLGVVVGRTKQYNDPEPRLWVTKENTVVLVPKKGTYQHSFTFRIRVYNLDGANLQQSAAPTMYRVVVKQRSAGPPKWSKSTITDYEVAAATSSKPVRLELEDQQLNLLTFRLLKAPKYGALYYTRTHFGTTKARALHEGEVFRMPKGTLFRSAVVVNYKCDGVAGSTYPLIDHFTIVAGDGTPGVYSEPKEFTVLVQEPQMVTDNKLLHLQSPTAKMAIAGVIMFLFGIIGLTVFIARRRKFDRRIYERVMGQAEGGTEMGNVPHPAVSS